MCLLLKLSNHVRKFSVIMRRDEEQYLPLCWGKNPNILSLNKDQGLNCTKPVLFTFHSPAGNPTEGVGQPQFCHHEGLSSPCEMGIAQWLSRKRKLILATRSSSMFFLLYLLGPVNFSF